MFELERIIKTESAKHDSFYLYDESSILRQLNTLKSNFPETEFLYSIKCNPNSKILNCIFAQGFSADAASLGEVELAYRHGVTKNHIYYSAPGKTENDIKQSLEKATIIADCLSEIERIQNIAEKDNKTVQIGIRINPRFSFYDNKGYSSKFGIDEEQATAFLSQFDSRFVSIIGIHVHLKSQELCVEALAEYWEKVFDLAQNMQELCKNKLEFLNLGSGMGIPYTTKDTPLDTERLGRIFAKQFNNFRVTHPNIKVLIEAGRYIVGKSGYYITKVLDRKVSYGKTYLILKNTLNGFIRPSLAVLIGKYSANKSPTATEPLFTDRNAFDFLSLKHTEIKEQVTLVGNLCTGADVIAENIWLPHLDTGDVIIITNAGAYAAAISPMQFSTMERPPELFVAINK